MNECVRRALPGLYLSAALLFTGAALLSGTSAAQAGDSVGNSGVGNGNQVEAPVSVPVNVCGNAVGVLGNAEASCDGQGKDKGGNDKPDDHDKTSSPSAKPTPTATSTRRTDPSATASPTASPGGGGSPELPRTGASLGWLIGAAVLFVGAGAGLIALARHRVRRGLHAA